MTAKVFDEETGEFLGENPDDALPRGQKGSGGLTFEPPTSPTSSNADLAFAPGLSEEDRALFREVTKPITPVRQRSYDDGRRLAPTKSNIMPAIKSMFAKDIDDSEDDGDVVDAVVEPAPLPKAVRGDKSRYPLARAAIARLYSGDDEDKSAPIIAATANGPPLDGITRAFGSPLPVTSPSHGAPVVGAPPIGAPPVATPSVASPATSTASTSSRASTVEQASLRKKTDLMATWTPPPQSNVTAGAGFHDRTEKFPFGAFEHLRPETDEDSAVFSPAPKASPTAKANPFSPDAPPPPSDDEVDPFLTGSAAQPGAAKKVGPRFEVPRTGADPLDDKSSEKSREKSSEQSREQGTVEDGRDVLGTEASIPGVTTTGAAMTWAALAASDKRSRKAKDPTTAEANGVSQPDVDKSRPAATAPPSAANPQVPATKTQPSTHDDKGRTASSAPPKKGDDAPAPISILNFPAVTDDVAPLAPTDTLITPRFVSLPEIPAVGEETLHQAEKSGSGAAEEEPPNESQSLRAFAIGPAVTRRPAEVATPKSARAQFRSEGSAAESQGKLESLVDTMLIGQQEARQDGEVHLQFKEDVLRGLYVSLTKEPEGFVAKFIVADATVRRQIDGHAQRLVNRLRDRGMAVSGYRIEVRDSEGAPARDKSLDDDHYDGF